jgi:hypothetical protein
MERSGVLFTLMIWGTVLKVQGFFYKTVAEAYESPVLLGPSPYEEVFNG